VLQKVKDKPLRNRVRRALENEIESRTLAHFETNSS
jgi:hypothetical protein